MGVQPLTADSPPAKPTGLQVTTTAGSPDVSVDWDDTPGATQYKVRWRVAGPGNPLNDGIEAQSSAATITVADNGEWVVRVEACNDTGCGLGTAKRFKIVAAAEPTQVPTPEPTPETTPEPTSKPVTSVPGRPTRLKVVEGTIIVNSVWVDWNDVPGATS